MHVKNLLHRTHSLRSETPPSNAALVVGSALVVTLGIALAGCVDEPEEPAARTELVLSLAGEGGDGPTAIHAIGMGERIYFYAPGGARAPRFLSFDVSTGGLLAERLMPTERNDFRRSESGHFAVHDDQLYFFGRYAQLYADRQWHQLPDPQEGRRHRAAIVSFNGAIWTIGGYSSVAPLPDVFAYSGGEDGTWTRRNELTPMPWRVANAAAAVVDDRLYVVGGEGIDELGRYALERRMALYDAEAGEWAQLRDAPAGLRTSDGVAALDGKLFVGMHAFDVREQTWTSLPSPPLDSFRVVAVDQQLYVVGWNGPDLEIHRLLDLP